MAYATNFRPSSISFLIALCTVMQLVVKPSFALPSLGAAAMGRASSLVSSLASPVQIMQMATTFADADSRRQLADTALDDDFLATIPDEIQECASEFVAAAEQSPEYQEAADLLIDDIFAGSIACADSNLNNTDFDCEIDLSTGDGGQALVSACLSVVGGDPIFQSYSSMCVYTDTLSGDENSVSTSDYSFRNLPGCIPPTCDREAYIQFLAEVAEGTLEDVGGSDDDFSSTFVEDCLYELEVTDTNGNTIVAVSGDGSTSLGQLAENEFAMASSSAPTASPTASQVAAPVSITPPTTPTGPTPTAPTGNTVPTAPASAPTTTAPTDPAPTAPTDGTAPTPSAGSATFAPTSSGKNAGPFVFSILAVVVSVWLS